MSLVEWNYNKKLSFRIHFWKWTLHIILMTINDNFLRKIKETKDRNAYNCRMPIEKFWNFKYLVALISLISFRKVYAEYVWWKPNPLRHLFTLSEYFRYYFEMIFKLFFFWVSNVNITQINELLSQNWFPNTIMHYNGWLLIIIKLIISFTHNQCILNNSTKNKLMWVLHDFPWLIEK